MNRVPVESSNVAAVGYADGVLEVEFLPKKTGPAVYQYTPVSHDFFLRLISGRESVGRLVHQMIGARVVTCTKVSASAESVGDASMHEQGAQNGHSL